jgi:hypothetical protein
MIKRLLALALTLAACAPTPPAPKPSATPAPVAAAATPGDFGGTAIITFSEAADTNADPRPFANVTISNVTTGPEGGGFFIGQSSDPYRTLSFTYKAPLQAKTYEVGPAGIELGYEEKLAGSPDPMGNVLVSHGWDAGTGSVTVDALGGGQLTLHFSVTFKPYSGGTGTFRLTGSVRCDSVNGR